jgi:chaperonin GroEL
MDLKRGLTRRSTAVVADLKKAAKNVKTNDEIRQVGMISANGERNRRKWRKPWKKSAMKASLPLRKPNRSTPNWNVVEGMQFDRGYLSPYFITDADKMQAVLENPYILLHESKLSNLQSMLPFWKPSFSRPSAAHRCGRRRRRSAGNPGCQQTARRFEDRCRQSPGFGDRRKAMLEDMAILTGGQVISEDLGIKLENVTLDMLGRRRKSRSRRTTRPSSMGKGKKKTSMPASISSQIEETESATTTRKNCRNVWRSWLAALRFSVLAARPKSK